MSNPILAQDIEPENVEWLWRDRIALGMFNMIAGKPDQGKSMIAAHIAAEITRQGGNVLYSSLERPFSLVERPRLEAAGAVLSRVHAAGPGTGYRFRLGGPSCQLVELAELLVRFDIRLLVMDPVSAHFALPTGSDKIRDVLTPFAEIVNKAGTAVLFIEHALKRVAPGSDPLSAIRGNSSGIPAACAMAYMFGSDPNNEENKVLACVKSNVRERPKAIQFEIDEVDVGLKEAFPALVYQDELEAFDPIRLVSRQSESGKVGRPNEKREKASQWLTNYLSAAGAPVLGSKVQEDAKQYGMTTRTLRRAARDMGIVKDPPGGGPNCTWWLPDDILDAISVADMPPVKLDKPAAKLEPPAERGPARDVLAWVKYVEGETGIAAEPESVKGEVVDDDVSFTDDELANWLKGLG